MLSCDWIICERTNRWAAALRLALDRQGAMGGAHYRLRETRHLDDGLLALVQSPDSLVAVEVHRQNLHDTLTWLALAERRFPRSRCIALVDRSLAFGDAAGGRSRRSDSRSDLCNALREAGATEIAHSPRDLAVTMELARRHFAVVSRWRESDAANRSHVEQVWSALPWQEA